MVSRVAAKTGIHGTRRLVIVESPAKAKTIAGYLGAEYVVESSIGHIRDLPNRASEIPEKLKKEPWARLGVDVDHDFEPLYVVDADKKQRVADLKRKLKDADELYLATDEDREGEAIAWHLLEVLKPTIPVRRMVFHEITKDAITRALGETREVDKRLVDAQETRRILDRLYGYEVSPVLWKKVMQGLSAGRVQSVAVRLVVERERERRAFISASYWDVKGRFDPGGFEARLVGLDGKRVAQGRDFAQDGTLKPKDTVVLDETVARGLVERFAGATFAIRSAEEKPYTRRPAAPFMTSTLQQEASRKLRFSAQTTMRVAQRLYENGYITYMRTDSTTLSESALKAARSQAADLYGAEYVPTAPRRYERKVKNAQEAHEAIRPAGDSFRTPKQVARELRSDELALYELVWKRTVASQMADARGLTLSLRLGASAEGTDVEFGASGTAITFRGFLAAYEESTDDEAAVREEERQLPHLAVGDTLRALELEPEGHATTPPARFTEASLVQALEERGIGRPSTYASIMGTILDRGYVFKRGAALVPSFLAFAVISLLEQHFGQLVDYQFTARMEDDLDRIAAGDEARIDWLRAFYFGAADDVGLKALVSDLGEIDARAVNTLPLGDGIALRVGRYGPYVERGEERASVPEDLAPDELTVAKAEELLAAPSGDRSLGVHPDWNRAIVAKSGRYGPYVTEVLEEGSKEKPRTSSLFKTMSPESVTLEDAVRLLSLPRVLGLDPADGEEVTAQNGKYGPYVKKGSESRSLESEEQLLTISLENALAVLAQPKERRGRGAAKPPLKELGPDPASGKPMLVKEGRFGPYVTDGETNASLRRGDDAASITVERGAELLADRRSRGPAPKKKPRTRRSAA
ncbi:MAG: type I DNA topoisomerase [Actinobacteria bacterium]|nr:type I DNA topoisomerase [Actinomycetota bacterium]